MKPQLVRETLTLFMQRLCGLRPPSGCVNLRFSPLFFVGGVSILILQSHMCLQGLLQPLGERHKGSLKQASIPKTLCQVPSMGHFQALLPFSGLVFSVSGCMWPRVNTARLCRDIASSKLCRPQGAQKPGHHCI